MKAGSIRKQRSDSRTERFKLSLQPELKIKYCLVIKINGFKEYREN